MSKNYQDKQIARIVVFPTMGFDKLVGELQAEWSVIRQAPILFLAALLVASGIIYALFRANLERKSELIKTLQDQLQLRPSVDSSQTGVMSIPAPSFRILLQGGNIFIPDDMPKLTGIALDVIITNTGKPSVALDWKLSVVPKDGKPKLAQLTKMPQSLVARGQFNTAHISASESLAESTLSSVLATDVPRSGKLLFYVEMPKTEVIRAVLELSVTDVGGHPFVARQDINDWLQR